MKRLIDLSFALYDKAPTFWPDPKTAITQHLKIENLKYNITQLVISTHLGTHLDAPRHFFDEGLPVDQLDLTRGFGPAWVLDFSDKGPNGRVSADELSRYEARITEGARIIIRFGWDTVFPEERYFSECPGLTPEACAYLAERRIACLALDVPTVAGSSYVESHHSLLGAEVLIVEALANLDMLTSERIFFAALPIKIKDCDGAPCRAIAIEGLTDAEMNVFEGLNQ
jgi:kynurenine formamidase